jgi:hypothetical protein
MYKDKEDPESVVVKIQSLVEKHYLLAPSEMSLQFYSPEIVGNL